MYRTFNNIVKVKEHYGSIPNLVIMQKAVPKSNNYNYDNDQFYRNYYVFDSLTEYIKHVEVKLNPECRTFFEVIKPGVVRKLYFDIDIKICNGEGPNPNDADVKSIIETIIGYTYDCLTQPLFRELNLTVNLNRIVVLKANRSDKLSCHLIFNDYLFTYHEFKYIYQFIENSIQRRYPELFEKGWIDFGIVGSNDSIKHFRPYNNTKLWKHSPLVFLDEWEYFDQTISFSHL